ncbi:hypothetical protein E2C01_095743 [Portunus trituberculatus]|nr:hypothetical protein [Portunus trituberculatus]
MQYAWT